MENTQPEEKAEGKKRDFLLPASILIAALIVSISLVYNAGKKTGEGTNVPAVAGTGDAIQPSPVNMKAITADDHIQGDMNAPVKLVVFSDLECPFCKQFHYTLAQATQVYGSKIAWVFRHSPIDQLHPKARKEAEASECAADQKGNDGFWKFVDAVFAVTPSNNGLDPAELPKIAGTIGLDVAKFNACLSSGKFTAKVEAQRQDAIAAGGGGTPYTVVIAKDGKTTFVVSGAYPFTSSVPGSPSVKAAIDQALQ
jgi:protein-disulfide isomerase